MPKKPGLASLVQPVLKTSRNNRLSKKKVNHSFVNDENVKRATHRNEREVGKREARASIPKTARQVISNPTDTPTNVITPAIRDKVKE